MLQGLVGSVVTAPYVLLFHATWTVASLWRPAAVVSLIAVLTNPSAAWKKFQLFVQTVSFLALCKDKKWKKTPDYAPHFVGATEIETKTIVFVRHGESTWNDTFNKGDRSTVKFIMGFFPGLVKAIYYELFFWITGQANESWFYDAPLSAKGLRQAESVQKYLQSNLEYMTPREAAVVKLLRGQSSNPASPDAPPDSQLVTSNLRRAVATLAVGFQDRLARELPDDRMLLLPSLQEISFNPDALCITPPHEPVQPAFSDPGILQRLYRNQLDARLHTGNKKLFGNGGQRLREFCHICFTEVKRPAVIAAGHSLWFRSFFRAYLPHSVEHVCKKKKLQNGGVVAFTLQRTKDANGEYQYLIDQKSLLVMHGGF